MESCQLGWRPLVGLNLVSSLRALKERDWETVFETKYLFLKIVFKKASMRPIPTGQPFFHPTVDGRGPSKLPCTFSLLERRQRWGETVTGAQRQRCHRTPFHPLRGGWEAITICSPKSLKGCPASMRVHMGTRQSRWERFRALNQNAPALYPPS